MANTKWTGKKVFITGATGLLGSHLTRQLVDAGADVTALIRDSVPRSTFHEWELDRRVNIVRGEVENFALMERAINEYEIDTIFHLAAQTIVGTANRGPLATFKANVEGTWNILEAARLHADRSRGGRIRRIVMASSDKAYGNLQGEAYDESFPLRGEHPYDVSKSCADLIARSFFVSYNLPVAVTRCGNFFGPGDLNFSRIIPGTVRDVLEGRAPVIRSDGKFIRDYIFAEDGAHAYMTLAEAMEERAGAGGAGGHTAHGGEAFNFSYGLRLTVRDVVDKVLAVMNRGDVKPVILNQASNEIPVQCLNSDKAKRVLGWKAKYGFEEGLRMTVEWYKKHYAR
ncbi:MAG: sugar dehydratase [Bdellovibrionales bacterium RIFOXYD1_FULL_53_11]|nr:MAG: sugar dehydratase [Bdellovibrionales bacterium RIFOXYD1_FULL_53_11]